MIRSAVALLTGLFLCSASLVAGDAPLVERVKDTCADLQKVQEDLSARLALHGLQIPEALTRDLATLQDQGASAAKSLEASRAQPAALASWRALRDARHSLAQMLHEFLRLVPEGTPLTPERRAAWTEALQALAGAVQSGVQNRPLDMIRGQGAVRTAVLAIDYAQSRAERRVELADICARLALRKDDARAARLLKSLQETLAAHEKDMAAREAADKRLVEIETEQAILERQQEDEERTLDAVDEDLDALEGNLDDLQDEADDLLDGGDDDAPAPDAGKAVMKPVPDGESSGAARHA